MYTDYWKERLSVSTLLFWWTEGRMLTSSLTYSVVSQGKWARGAVISHCPFDNSCTSNNQTLRSAGDNDRSSKRFCSNVWCALRKFHVTDGQNTRDQITRDRRSKRGRSNCVLCIPFILSGSPNECWLHTCDACVIRTWRLGCGLLLSPAMKRLFCLLKVPLFVKTNWNERMLYEFISGQTKASISNFVCTRSHLALMSNNYLYWWAIISCTLPRHVCYGHSFVAIDDL